MFQTFVCSGGKIGTRHEGDFESKFATSPHLAAKVKDRESDFGLADGHLSSSSVTHC